MRFLLRLPAPSFRPWLVLLLAFSMVVLTLFNVEQANVIAQQRKTLVVFMHDSQAYYGMLDRQRHVARMRAEDARNKKAEPAGPALR
jgi:hypothetical protein